MPRVKELNPLVSSDVLRAADLKSVPDETLTRFGCVALCDVDLQTQLALAERCHALHVPIIAATLVGFWGFFFLDAGVHEYSIDFRVDTANGEAPKPSLHKTARHKSLAEAMAVPWAKLSEKAIAPAAFAYMALLHAAGAGEVGPTSTPAQVQAAVRSHAARLCASGAATKGRVDDGPDGAGGVIAAMAGGYGRELSAVATVVGGVVGKEVIKVVSRKEEPAHNLFAFDALGGTGGNVNCFA